MDSQSFGNVGVASLLSCTSCWIFLSCSGLCDYASVTITPTILCMRVCVPIERLSRRKNVASRTLNATLTLSFALMPTPSQGTSGPSGSTGLQSAPVQLLSEGYTQSKQTPAHALPERSLVNEIRKLTVSIPIFFIARTHKPLGAISPLSKRFLHCTRCG